MKKVACIMVFVFICSFAFAYMPEIQPRSAEEVVAMSDKNLIDAYIDVLVELEALKSFHTTSGFKPEEYKSYKALLKYRILLHMELKKRELTVPSG